MSTSTSSAALRRTPPLSSVQHLCVFAGWCLRRETCRFGPLLVLAVPLIVLDACLWLPFPLRWRAGLGDEFLMVLVGLAALVILGGGAFHAAQAICWEVSPELREVVRMTGIGGMTLLCTRSLSRWLTIGFSVLLLAPLVGFAITLGGVTTSHLAASGAALLMLAFLTAGFALVAGISATESHNSSTTAAMGTFLLMLLYHMVFWLAALSMYLLFGIPRIPALKALYDFAWQSAPFTLVVRACRAPTLFSPLSPSYWMHFITAFCLLRMASVVMINRFRSIRGPDDVPPNAATSAEDGAQGTAMPRRPRCSSAPLFWKDAYLLSGGFTSRSRWTFLYASCAVVVLMAGLSRPDGERSIVAAVIALCTWPLILSVRLDGLIAAEFRDQTWQSLMLLPIDRRTLLWSKVQAVAWEQWAVVFPVGLAVALAVPRAPVAIMMTGVIATLTAVLLGQVSTVYYLSRRHWWSGPVQIAACLTLIVLCLLIWISFDHTISFFMTVTLLLAVLLPVQAYIHGVLESWTE